MKILIIDDEKSIRLALKDILDDEGYQVDLAEDGKSGLQKAMEGMPHQAMMALVSSVNVPLQGIAMLTHDEPIGPATDTCFLEHPLCGTS